MRQRIHNTWWALLFGMALALAPAGHAANSVVRALDMTVARGETNHVFIVLDSVGIENGVELSLCFDKNLLTFVSAVRGVDAPGTTFFSNTNQLSSGRLGLFLGLPTDVAFDAGPRNIIDVSFRAAPGLSSAVTPMTICDLPLGRETVNVEANPIATDYVSGNVTIVGSCSYSISPSSRNHGPGAATNGITLTTSNGCAWSVINTNDWITFSTAASGSGSFSNVYSVLANPNPVGRTGVVQIADQIFTVSQDPVACSYSLSPKSRSHGNGAAANTVGVTTSAGCNWTATTTNSWILLESGTNGPGSGTVGYSVLANPNAAERIGAILIGDQTMVLTQKAASCTVSLPASSASHASGATNSSFAVTSAGGCTWTVSNTNSWITLTSSTNGANNGTVTYSATANSSAARSGVITVVGASNSVTFTVSQSGAICSYSLSPTNGMHSSSADTGTVNVATSFGCAWTFSNSNSWITILTPTNNSGSGTVTYAVSANAGVNARTGTVVIAGQAFAVTQTGIACNYSLSPVSRNHGYGAATNTVSLTTSNGCAWTIVNGNSWITIESALSGSGSVTSTYSVLANPNPVVRTGLIQIAGQTLIISQDALPCSFSLSPKSRSHGPGVATNTVDVTTGAGCPWTATTTNNWILLQLGTNGPGNGTVTYAVLANPNAQERVGAVFIGDQSLVLTQKAASCTVSLGARWDPLESTCRHASLSIL